MSSQGRHSGGLQSRSNKNDSIIKKYRPLVPSSLSDAALHDLIRKCGNSDVALQEEIQSLWDKEAEKQNVESEFCVVAKKTKKKEVTAAPRSDRGLARDRSNRGGGGGAAVRGTGDRSSKGGVRATADERDSKISAVEKMADSPDPLDPAAYPAVNAAATAARSLNPAGTQEMQVTQSSVANNSVWGGGSSLAQKIKTAEKKKTEVVVVPDEVTVAENSSEESASNREKLAAKVRPRRDKKNAVGKSGGRVEAAVAAPVAEVPAEVVETGSEQRGDSIVEVNSNEAVVDSKEVVNIVVEQVESPDVSESLVGEIQAVSVSAPPAELSSKKFVTLGKWATPSEPISESGFQFGSFGIDSSSSAPPSRGTSSGRGQKSPGKNWKSGDNKKQANNSHGDSNSSAMWENSTGGSVIAPNNGDFGSSSAAFVNSGKNTRQNTDSAMLAHASVTGPPGLSASQGLDSNKSHNLSNNINTASGQRGNSSKKSGGDSEHVTGKQQNAPPGINQRTPAGVNGFGGIMPGGMVPNMPYGAMPYDIGHQAPSLHHAGTYGMMQPNFPTTAVVGSASTASNPTAVSAGGASTPGSTGQASTPSPAAVPPSQHQGGYQSPPPGMATYMPYGGYNQPYYGQQFYYGGQPQPYYGRGQPMYQQPPRNMYGGDGYGSGAPVGYPDMYGAQSGQFGDTQYGGMHHHGQGGHGSSDRGGKQKNTTSNSAGLAQQTGNGAVDSHPHSGYAGYGGGSYAGRDGPAQYGYQQGGWSPAPMMYAQATPNGGSFQGSGSRGPHDNSSKGLNGSSGYSGSSGQYVGGGRGSATSSNTGSSSQPSSNTGSNMQAGGW